MADCSGIQPSDWVWPAAGAASAIIDGLTDLLIPLGVQVVERLRVEPIAQSSHASTLPDRNFSASKMCAGSIFSAPDKSAIVRAVLARRSPARVEK